MTARKPRMLAYTTLEGAAWHKWTPKEYTHLNIHSLLFSDGSIWDMRLGWRPKSSWYTQLRIRQLRNEWKRNVVF